MERKTKVVLRIKKETLDFFVLIMRKVGRDKLTLIGIYFRKRNGVNSRVTYLPSKSMGEQRMDDVNTV